VIRQGREAACPGGSESAGACVMAFRSNPRLSMAGKSLLRFYRLVVLLDDMTPISSMRFPQYYYVLYMRYRSATVRQPWI
jgi:hypothetical protein